MYDPKYYSDPLMQQMMRNNVLDQLLYAFNPQNYRPNNQPMPAYMPGQQGQSSFLDQLLKASTAQAQAQAQQPAKPETLAPEVQDPLTQLLEEQKKNYWFIDGSHR